MLILPPDPARGPVHCRAMAVLRFQRVEALAEMATLARILGPVVGVGRRPVTTSGRSGASHERVDVRLRSGAIVRLILKRVHLAGDWTAFRSGDAVGREAMLLAETVLAAVWEAFACPYRAYAVEEGEVGLLMDDLSERLLPEGAPVDEEREERLLGALAGMHAQFWASSALELPWLASPSTAFTILGPDLADEDPSRWPPFGDQVARGWEIAHRRLPARVWDLLQTPPEELAEGWRDLSRTLVHGDAKLSNFAWLAEGRVAAFDWAGLGAAPVGRELGYYLAINAPRLPRTKEATLDRYRARLAHALGASLSDADWRRQVDAAVLTGGLTLLWQKALALESAPTPAAEAEFAWWADRLAALAA
jgi:hypothetical protein